MTCILGLTSCHLHNNEDPVTILSSRSNHNSTVLAKYSTQNVQVDQQILQ